MSFTHDKLADNIYWIREEDTRECFPLMYLILGTEDTGNDGKSFSQMVGSYLFFSFTN